VVQISGLWGHNCTIKYTLLFQLQRCSMLDTAQQTRSQGYQDSTQTAFMTHIASAIRLAPSKHNKESRKYIALTSLLYKWKLKHTPPVIYHITKGPHTRTVLPSVLTAQAKLCQVCSVLPARGFATHVQLNLKNIDQFSL